METHTWTACLVADDPSGDIKHKLEDAYVRVVDEPDVRVLGPGVDIVMELKKHAGLLVADGSLSHLRDIVAHFREAAPECRVLVISQTDLEDAVADLLEVGVVEHVRAPISPRELEFRLETLASFRDADERASRDVELQRFLESLHDPESGRVDANKVARALGISTSELARGLGAHRAAVSKTPDAASLQPGLRELRRAFELLWKLRGSAEAVRAWLNASNPELDDHAPIDFVKEGRIADLRAFVEAAYAGIPA